MKLSVFAGLFVAVAVTLAYYAPAATFRDELAAVNDTAETKYYGLIAYTGNTSGFSDTSMATFPSGAFPLGSAVYRVNGAEEITVGFYTRYGTCVSRKDNSFVLGPGVEQALWSTAANAIYYNPGGSLYQIKIDNTSFPVFSPVGTALPGDAAGYGLNIYPSSAGGAPLPVAVTKSLTESFCYEEYTAAVPPSAQYLRVEINDVTSFPVISGQNGGVISNLAYTRLASVKISGASLVMGEPERVVYEQPVMGIIPVGGDEEEEDSESVSKASEAWEETEFEGIANIPEEESSSSKFEGTITSSSKIEKKQTSKSEAPTGSEASQPESVREESPYEPEPAPPLETVYEVRREKEDGLVNTGVTAYIIVVTGALSLLLIFGKRL